ncbi:MAG: hypothetical protein WC789_10640 [Lentisphaeria bacterium]
MGGLGNVQFKEDYFASKAAEYAEQWGTPPGDAHEDLDRELKGYEPRLALKYHTPTRRFWVCTELLGYSGLYFPALNVGYCPDHSEVMAKVRENVEKVRRREAAREHQKQVEAMRERDARLPSEMGEAAMPDFPRVLHALHKHDDAWARRQKAEEIAKDMRRVFHRPTVDGVTIET